MKYLFALMIIVTLTSCEDLISDCINFDGPEFGPVNVPSAILNQVYGATITASIDNNPFDDLYSYSITYSGNLPGGLQFYRDGNDRTIQITGTPMELGSYEFTLWVKVTDPDNVSSVNNDGNDLCYTTNEEKYVLNVLQS